jgi:hypothetical protein
MLEILTKISFDAVFQKCVQFLQFWARIFGISYEEINIWIFVIIQPIVFLIMCYWIYTLYRRINKLKIEVEKGEEVRIWNSIHTNINN